jgi:hypothetical protein
MVPLQAASSGLLLGSVCRAGDHRAFFQFVIMRRHASIVSHYFTRGLS